MSAGYTTSADYEHLDVALKSYWTPFNKLLEEMDEFIPRSLSDFEDEGKVLTDKVRKRNPSLSDLEVDEIVERELKGKASAECQFSAKFSDRFMTMYVTVTLLSQALCEAEINVFLAVGLHENGLADQFEKIERKGIKDKWLSSPKIFAPKYELKENSAVFETLIYLIEQRNSWVHHKVELQVGEKNIMKGSNLDRVSFKEGVDWMKRFFSLPYDLADHMHSKTQLHHAAIFAYKRSPIPIADIHKKI